MKMVKTMVFSWVTSSMNLTTLQIDFPTTGQYNELLRFCLLSIYFNTYTQTNNRLETIANGHRSLIYYWLSPLHIADDPYCLDYPVASSWCCCQNHSKRSKSACDVWVRQMSATSWAAVSDAAGLNWVQGRHMPGQTAPGTVWTASPCTEVSPVNRNFQYRQALTTAMTQNDFFLKTIQN